MDQDLNRQWLDERMDAGDSSERRRCAALRPFCAAGRLAARHPLHARASAPLLLTGVQPRNLALARAMHCALSTSWWTPGTKTACACATTAASGLPDDQAGDTRSLLIECGFHGDPASLRWPGPVRALHRTVGVISAAALAQQLPGWRLPDAPRQWALEVTQPVVARSAAFRFVEPFTGLECIEKQGTVIGDNDGEPVLTRTTIACW